jgi:hypothetical protein
MGHPGPGSGINPGVSGLDYGVFAIQAGATPTSIWVDQSTPGSEPGVSTRGIELAL